MSDQYANVIKLVGGASETAVDLVARMEVDQIAICPYEDCIVWKSSTTTYERFPNDDRVLSLISSNALTQVETDETLTGNGTVGSPLSVVNPSVVGYLDGTQTLQVLVDSGYKIIYNTLNEIPAGTYSFPSGDGDGNARDITFIGDPLKFPVGATVVFQSVDQGGKPVSFNFETQVRPPVNGSFTLNSPVSSYFRRGIYCGGGSSGEATTYNLWLSETYITSFRVDRSNATVVIPTTVSLFEDIVTNGANVTVDGRPIEEVYGKGSQWVTPGVQRNNEQDVRLDTIEEDILNLLSASMSIVSATNLTGIGTTQATATRWNFNISTASDNTAILDANATSDYITLKDGGRRYQSNGSFLVDNSSGNESSFYIQGFVQGTNTPIDQPKLFSVPKSSTNIPVPASDLVTAPSDDFSFWYGVWSPTDSAHLTIKNASVTVTSGSGAIQNDADFQSVINNSGEVDFGEFQDTDRVWSFSKFGQRWLTFWGNGKLASLRAEILNLATQFFTAAQATITNLTVGQVNIGNPVSVDALVNLGAGTTQGEAYNVVDTVGGLLDGEYVENTTVGELFTGFKTYTISGTNKHLRPVATYDGGEAHGYLIIEEASPTKYSKLWVPIGNFYKQNVPDPSNIANGSYVGEGDWGGDNAGVSYQAPQAGESLHSEGLIRSAGYTTDETPAQNRARGSQGLVSWDGLSEVGTFDPNPRFGGSSTGVTGTFSGSYIKIGRFVTANYNFTFTSKGTTTGPFSADVPYIVSDVLTGTGVESSGSISYSTGFTENARVSVIYGEDVLRIYKLVTSNYSTPVVDTDFSDSTSLRLTINYITD